MNCKEIVKKYLEENGFDGLFACGECACTLEDLVPCCGTMADCQPGYKRAPRPNEQHLVSGGENWVISASKPNPDNRLNESPSAAVLVMVNCANYSDTTRKHGSPKKRF